MMYPFMTLNDETEIVHSDMQNDGRVKVYIERPDEKYGFKHAACWLPDYTWEDIYHFSEEEIKQFEEIIRSTAHLIIEFSQEGALKMPQIFRMGEYRIYFWTNENKPVGPIHVHITKGKPSENATKIWITSAGKCLLCNNNPRIPSHTFC